MSVLYKQVARAIANTEGDYGTAYRERHMLAAVVVVRMVLDDAQQRVEALARRRRSEGMAVLHEDDVLAAIAALGEDSP